MFTQQHFIATAKVLHKNFAISTRGAERDAVTRTVLDFADLFALDNPRFNRLRFYRAVEPDFIEHLASYSTHAA